MAYDFEKEKREARDQVRDAIWKVENVNAGAGEILVPDR